MRKEERRLGQVLLRVAALGLVLAVVFPLALFGFGLWVAPQWPTPPTTAPPPLVLDALWARAEGGRATELRSVNPISMVEFAACMIAAEGQNDNERAARCTHVMPALRGLEYVATLHIQDHGIERNSFRGGHAQFATMLWITRSWSKQDFLNTLAARGQFGHGWRGITAAARGYFGKAPDALTLPEAAVVAARVAARGLDSWCETDTVIAMRNRVLTSMRDNGAITEAQFEEAQAAPLALAAPPADHAPCRD